MTFSTTLVVPLLDQVQLSHYRLGQTIRAQWGWRSQNFSTIGTSWYGCQPHALANFTPKEISLA